MSISQPNTNIHILDNVNKLRDFFNTDQPHEYITLDTETDGVQEKTSKLYGIGICFTEQDAYYIPIRNTAGELLWSEKTLSKLASELKSIVQKHKLLGHNIIFDILILKNNLGIDLTEHIHTDTILLKHCIDEEPPFGLKETSVKYLGHWADKAQQKLFENIKKNGGKTTKENLEMYKADTDVLAEYCAWDVILTHLLFQYFSPKLKEQELEDLFYRDEIMPLYKECVIPMKDRGFPIDVDHFQKLQADISTEILRLEDEIQEEIKEHTEEFITTQLDAEFPAKPTGSFAKELAATVGFPNAEILTKALVKKSVPEVDIHVDFKNWYLSPEFGLPEIFEPMKQVAQKRLFHKRYPEDRYIFNLNSTKHLAWLFFEKLGMESTEKTESGAPKLDAATLEGMAGEHPFCDKIIEYKKLQKIKGTYIDGILDRQYQGVIYGSFLMFGTTSGRFSSQSPNIQNLPRVKDEESNLSPLVLKYVNSIKRGFIAGSNNLLVFADFSQLEPCAFAAASGDSKLQQIFKDKGDLYSAIAIEAEGLEGEYSADKKAPNYLKNFRPELRQQYKATCLAVVYGAESYRISEIIGCSRDKAQEIIDNYLGAYPGLVQYMKDCDEQVTKKGFIRNKFGRIRHLPEAKRLASIYGNRLLDRKWVKENDMGEVRWKFKNLLNNGKNFKIQSLAAHIVNRAMLSTTRALKKENIDAYIVTMIHDEIGLLVKEDQATQAAKILKDCMENTTKIEVPLIAEPMIAYNMSDTK